MVFWRAIAAASAACRAFPPATSTTAAAAIAPATPISTWHPAVSAAKVARFAMIKPTTDAASKASVAASRDTPPSSVRLHTTPGITPAEPPVGAAQTTPRLLQVCMTAMARAAARAWIPPV